MTCQIENLIIQQGKTFSRVVRWETTPLVYKVITAISKASPVNITAAGHGIPDGWRAAVTGVSGMRQMNAARWPPQGSDFHAATLVDSSHVTFNDTSSELYTAYVSGGAIVYYTPVDLASFTARMQIRATLASDDALLSLTTSGVDPLTGITLNNTTKTITLLISATDTAAIDWLAGVYDLELVSSTGVVTQVLKGDITVETEVTR